VREQKAPNYRQNDSIARWLLLVGETRFGVIDVIKPLRAKSSPKDLV
jgi:hypothetical protein